MKRWLPRSLFGRLLLVLAGGLLVAQLLSAAINLAERDRLLVAAGGMQQAQRIADVVKLLDSLGPAERARIASVLNVPPLVLTLQPAATPAESAEAPRALVFTAFLRASLGGEREVRVEAGAPWAGGPDFGPGHHHRMMMGGRPGAPGPALRTQVQLRDGSWARFDTQLRPASQTPPWRLALALAVLLLAVLGLSYVAVRWVTRPLHVLAEAADALGRDIHRPPLAEDGPTEIRRAALAFNSMQQRLVRFIEDRTRIFAAMSHDLKTPITRMRLRTDLLEDEELRQRFEADLKEMETMVTQTLEFMRGMGSGEARQEVDVNALLESLQSDNEAMGREVRLEGQARAAYPAQVSLLRRCLANLVDNAVTYAERATLRVEDTPQALVIRVLDDGPGIPEKEREKVFEPFYRLEASRSRATGGTGLGLAIARNIARLHGGDIALRNRSPRGLEATLTLPRIA
ncbi:MAG TPA: ATP-binding protein [Ramlibacter sp.]|uniref:ATP-binding protein n=1 Tax=Ramlibacter sp. TaxID=1917967 RepID=UPI002D7F62A6|nr:ATP-binding protein [Ramlibacter sp.]HET8745822.1 ATP-binding protein [Ramlibacter sp.]